jgi:hypothetical protein
MQDPGKREKLPEIETHLVVRPRSSQNSGAERIQQSLEVTAIAPELNPRG